MKNLHKLRDVLNLFIAADQQATVLDGILLIEMGQLARRYGVTRWKRAPGGTGTNAEQVQLGLMGDGLSLYAQLANRAAGAVGTRMTTDTLRNIAHDDLVIVLDDRHHTARQLLTGTFEFSTPADPDALKHYRGDTIRAAAYNDALRVGLDFLHPRFLQWSEEQRGAA